MALLAVATLFVPAGAAISTSAPAGAQTAPDTSSNVVVPAYWLVATDGGVFAFGGAGFYGSTGAMTLNKPVVGMAGAPDAHGYWLVATDGGIFAFGSAGFYGSTGSMVLNKPVVGMTATKDGGGYWMVASDGGIFAFGDANFYGSMGGSPLNQPVVGMSATPDGGGYWLVAADGGIFAFGDANFYGSTGNIHLNQPIVAMTPTPTGNGYWFTATDGGVFAYGDANFYGSLGATPQARPIVGMSSTPSGKGYWFTNNNGAVSAFGDATYWGSAPQVLTRPIVGIATTFGSGGFGGSAYQSGAYGYDVSNYNCPAAGGAGLPPPPHAIGIVEVVGNSFGATNPCLAQEAAWAGGGLNFYVFLSYGAVGVGPASCGGDGACNYGFNAAQDAYMKAVNAGVNTQVTWWLDVEPYNWSGNLAENAQLVQGAITGLRAEGLNNVGIYSSPALWNAIVGSYQPAVPFWMADYLNNPSGPASCADYQRWVNMGKRLPSGGLQVVQYDSNVFDDDYAC